MYYAVKQNETYLFRNKFFLYIGYIYINFWSIWNLLIEKYGALFRKKNNFFAHKIFFWCSIILFLSTGNNFLCYINFFLMTWNTFSCNFNTFLSKPNYFLCNVKRFISTQNYFSCNTKFLFWTSFRMLCHGDIFLLSHSNKNIITSQKINKLSFLCDTQKNNSVFCASP